MNRNEKVSSIESPEICVYDTYCMLNKAAIELLDLTIQAPYIGLKSADGSIYIKHTSEGAILKVLLDRYRQCARICSPLFARAIATTLQGRGRYRISTVCYESDNKCYRILPDGQL